MIPETVENGGTVYSVTSIGDYAFSGCGGLTSVTIPNSVTSIDSNAFYGVGTVIYGGNATGSPWGASNVYYADERFAYSDTAKTQIFKYVGKDSVVTIPNSITSIGEKAFSDCSDLISVTFPKSITSIGEKAFSGCTKLNSITCYATTPPTLEPSAFPQNEMIVTVPCSHIAGYKKSDWGQYSDITFTEDFLFDFIAESTDDTLGTVEIVQQPDCGTDARIKATASEHYHFVNWSDGNIDNPRTITVTSDTTLMAMFAIDTLKVVVNAENGNVSGAGEYAYGAETSLTATPAEHYHFAKWSDGNTENPRLVTVASDTILTAVFAIDTLKVTITAQNGTVEGAGEYAYGTNITLTATPAENYKFSRWSDGNTDNPRTITVTEDITLEAIFEKADAISANAANEVKIYAHHNTVVIENAQDDVYVFDESGKMVARQNVTSDRMEMQMPSQGIYIVRIGDKSQRVFLK